MEITYSRSRHIWVNSFNRAATQHTVRRLEPKLPFPSSAGSCGRPCAAWQHGWVSKSP